MVGLEGWNVSEVKELDIFDLLGREPVVPNQFLVVPGEWLIKICYGNSVSIGGELCGQIVQPPLQFDFAGCVEFAFGSDL